MIYPLYILGFQYDPPPGDHRLNQVDKEEIRLVPPFVKLMGVFNACKHF